jgi:two-component system chemotaxis response regulator CheB
MTPRDLFVIGASAGGVEALRAVVAALRPGLPASVFVLLHLAPGAHSALPEILGRAGRLPAAHPRDGETIVPARIYVGPPGLRMTVGGGRVRLHRPAAGTGGRTSIDDFFCSVADGYGERAVGVVLTGNLHDGTAGLAAIQRSGGLTVVQDPAEAAYPGMPASAVAGVAVDYVLPLAGIGPLLDALAG